MNAFVVGDAQSVAWVDVTAEEVRRSRASSVSFLTHLKLATNAGRDSQMVLLSAWQLGIGIPCHCGCETVTKVGERVLKVSSPFRPISTTTFYYYATVGCERRAMTDVAVAINRGRRKRINPVFISLVEKPI